MFVSFESMLQNIYLLDNIQRRYNDAYDIPTTTNDVNIPKCRHDPTYRNI